MTKFKNDEAGYAAFDKARSDKISEINVLCQELGIGFPSQTMQVARFNALVDFMCGDLEGEEDPETGIIKTTRASGDRMEYEITALDLLMHLVETAGRQAANRGGSGLYLPGRE